MAESFVDSLADAVADGERIDWHLVSSRLTSDDDRALAAQLKSLAELRPSLDGRVAEPAMSAHLLFPLEIAARAAVVVSLFGALGLSVLLPSSGTRAAILLAGVALFGVGAAWLWRSSGETTRARALSAAYWAVAVSFAAPGVAALGRMLPESRLVTTLVAIRPEVFMPAFFWGFIREFPAVTRFGRLDRLSRQVQIVAIIVGTGLLVANLTSALARSPAESSLWWLSRAYNNGRWFWLSIFILTMPALILMAVRAKDAPIQERSRVRLFLFSVIFAILPVALEVTGEALVPGFAAYISTPTPTRWAPWLIYPPLFSFPVLTAYVLLVHDVLEIRMNVQRGVRYMLARSLLAWGTAVPIAVLGIIFYAHRHESVTLIFATPAARLLAWAAAICVVLLACRQSLLGALDRWLANDVELPSTSLARLGEALRNARTPLEVANAMGVVISRALQAELEIYVIDDHGRMVRAEGDGPSASPESFIPILARGIGHPFVIDSHGHLTYRSLLSESDRKWISQVGTSAVCPVTVSDLPELLVVLNRRRTTVGFSSNDVQFLTAACGSAALVGRRVARGESGAELQEELAVQCSKCKCVAKWSDENVCGCGGTYRRAALPAVVGNRFRVEALLGAGGMGIAYRAWDLQLHRAVALKTLPRLSGDAAHSITREARAMAALMHPHVAVIYSVETWRETPLLVVEYLSGGTLASRLDHGRIDPVPALVLAEALADTLAHMHALGHSHGDIKPSNIAFTDSDIPKFLDFGLSRGPDTDGDEDDSQRGGTLAYMSPEAINLGSVRAADDLWALSVVLCQAISGVHPFLDGRRTVDRIRAGSASALGLSRIQPPSLVAFLETLLDPSTEKRPVSAKALATSMVAIRRDL